MDWHRRLFARSLAIVCVATPVFARNTLISVEMPYSSGHMALEHDDTIAFSSGIALLGVGINNGIPEGPWSLTIACMGVAYGHVGVRWSPGITRTQYCAGPLGFAGSLDSVLTAVTSMPDSMEPFDTACIYYVAGNAGGYLPLGVALRDWLCTRLFNPPYNNTRWVEDWKIISYAHCPDGSHMAFQFVNDTVLGGPTGQVVRWAVDSAGNGVFRIPPVAVKPGGLCAPGACRMQRNGELFDLRGSLLSGAMCHPWRGPVVRRHAPGGHAVLQVQVQQRWTQ